MSFFPRIIDCDERGCPHSTLFGAQWEVESSQPTALHNTLLVCRAQKADSPNATYAERPWMRINFKGASEIRVVGRPTRNLRVNYTHEIDGEDSNVAGGGEAAPPESTRDTGIDFSGEGGLVGKDGVTLFSLPVPPPSQSLEQTLTLYPYRGQLFIDYLELVPPRSSPETPPPTADDTNAVSVREEYIVDDEHPRIRYTPPAVWEKIPTFESVNEPIVSGVALQDQEVIPLVPYGVGWASTSTNGSSFEFDFIGNFVAAHGPSFVPNPRVEGRLVVSYTLLHQGNRTIARHPATATVYNSFSRARGWRNNRYFLVDTPSPDYWYTLMVEVVEIVPGQTFRLDTLTFGTNPNLIPTEPTFIDRSSERPRQSAMIGGVVGGIIALLLIITTFILLRRRRRRRERRAAGAVAGGEEGTDEAITLSILADAQERQDWEGPTHEAAPPPWTPPSNASVDEPPPPAFNDGAALDSLISTSHTANQPPSPLPSPPPSSSPIPAPSSALQTTHPFSEGSDGDVQTAASSDRHSAVNRLEDVQALEREQSDQRRRDGMPVTSREGQRATTVPAENPPPYTG